MALLSKKLEEIRAQFIEQGGQETRQVLDLGAKLRQLNERVAGNLDDILEELTEQRAEIHQKLATLAQCLGRLPPPAERPERPLVEDAGGQPLPEMFERAKREAAALAERREAEGEVLSNGIPAH